jgi:outer membrane protein
MLRRAGRSALLFAFLAGALLALPQESPALEYSLEDLHGIALRRAERIKISEEEVVIAEKDRDKAESALVPNLNAFGNYTKYTETRRSSTGFVVQPDYSTQYGLRLDQSLSLSGKEFTSVNIAKENITRRGYDLSSVKEEYLFSVSVSFYRVLKARKLVEIAHANIERLEKQRDAASTRLRVGEVTKTALLRAEAELSGAHSDLVRVENGLSLARAALARLVGIDGDYDVMEPSGGDRPVTDYVLPQLKEIAFAERPELKSLALQTEIQKNHVKVARGAFWPTLAAEGVYLERDLSPSSQFTNEESIYAGLTINIPIFEGGLRRAEVGQALARERQSRLAYEDYRRTVALEVEGAYLDFMTQKGILKALEDQLAFARDNYSAVTKQFELGLATSIDTVDANTLLVTAERQLADADYDLSLSQLVIKRATGTLLKTAGAAETK